MKRPNILLFIIDSLRFDCIRHLTHLWADLFDKSYFFTHYFTNGHCSDPNFASLLTGMPPWEHRLLHQANDHQLSKKIITLPEQLAGNRGYSTYIRTNFSKWAPRFQTHKQPEFREDNLKDTLEEVYNLPQPFFAILHTDDCHIGDYKMKGGYVKAVEITDKLCTTFLANFDKFNKHPNTVIIFTADHGEHMQFLHNYNFYNAVIHIPLFIHFKQSPGSDVQLGLFQHTDLHDWILDIANYKTNWLKATPNEQIFFRGDCRQNSTIPCEQFGVLRGDWKLVRLNTNKETTAELYNIVEDPEDLHPYASHQHLTQRAELETLMANHISDYRLDVIEDQQLITRLTSLGYLE